MTWVCDERSFQLVFSRFLNVSFIQTCDSVNIDNIHPKQHCVKVSNVNTSLLPVSLFAGVSDKTGINNVVDNVTAVWLRLSRVSLPSRLDLSAVFSRYGQDRDRGSCMRQIVYSCALSLSKVVKQTCNTCTCLFVFQQSDTCVLIRHSITSNNTQIALQLHHVCTNYLTIPLDGQLIHTYTIQAG